MNEKVEKNSGKKSMTKDVTELDTNIYKKAHKSSIKS